MTKPHPPLETALSETLHKREQSMQIIRTILQRAIQNNDQEMATRARATLERLVSSWETLARE